MTLLKPGSAAIISLIFGEYVMRLVYSPSAETVAAAAQAGVMPEAPEWSFKVLGCLSASSEPFLALVRPGCLDADASAVLPRQSSSS